MPSLKSRAVALVLRHTRKKAFRTPENLNRWIASSRLTQDHRPPPALARRVSVTASDLGGHTVYEVRPRHETSPRRILYLHGGAYVFEITRYHWHLIAEMSERLGMRVTVPIYPLAPEHRFDDIVDMITRTWRRMLDETDAADVVFMGDSAGGNMAVVLTMMAAQDGLPLPARHVLISPGLDMTLENPDVIAAAIRDPWLDIDGGLEAVRHYAPHIDRADWRISPTRGDLSVLPPMLILAGTNDLLTPDTLRFVERARQAGVEVELELGADMIHVWPLIDMPEARRARDRIVAYLSGVPTPPPAGGMLRRLNAMRSLLPVGGAGREAGGA